MPAPSYRHFTQYLISRTITFKVKGTEAFTNTSTLTLAKPAGIVAGDVMLAYIGKRFKSSLTGLPSGWTKIYEAISTGNTDFSNYVCMKVATGSEPANYAFGFDSIRACGVICAYTGIEPNVAIAVDAWSADLDSFTTTLVAPTVTPAVDGDLLIAMFGIETAGFGWADYDPAGMTNRMYCDDGTYLSGGYSVNDQVLGAPGATGNKQTTINSTRQNNCGLLALKPASLALELAPSPVVITLALPDPSLEFGGGAPQTLTPDPVALVLTAPAPALSLSLTLTPQPAVLTLVLPEPTVERLLTLTPEPAVFSLVLPEATLFKLLALGPTPVVLHLELPCAWFRRRGRVATTDAKLTVGGVVLGDVKVVAGVATAEDARSVAGGVEVEDE